ncbi:MAG: molybdenum cofactor biosynthesis protein, partial [Pirellulaceae bacterium]|nr:molybdenum cofactor biosynthesis protein [Pirellulaceae bacterium]
MPAIHEEHQKQGPQSARCAVITVSDTRTPETDTGGQTV